MKMAEAIARVKNWRPGTVYSEQEMIRWLSDLDGRIRTEVLAGFENPPQALEYNEGDIHRELLAEPPYDQMYPLYLLAQVDFYNAEMGRYNNTMEMFNEVFDGYQKYISRTRKTTHPQRVRLG